MSDKSKNILSYILLALAIVGIIITAIIVPPNHHHNLVKLEEQAATCTQDGHIHCFECSGCGQYFADKEGKEELKDIVIKATGHKLGASGYDYDTFLYNGVCENGCGTTLTDVKAGASQNLAYLVDNPSHAQSALEEIGKTRDRVYVQLEDNVTFSGTEQGFVVGKNMEIVLNLNGKILLDEEKQTIDNFGELTICDLSQEGNGRIDGKSGFYSCIVNEQDASLTINSGEIYRSQKSENIVNNAYKTHACLTNYGSTTINGGKIYALNSNIWARAEGATSTDSSSLIENGWKDAQGHGSQGDEISMPAIRDGEARASLVINGGEFIGGKHTIENTFYGDCQIKGGKFYNGDKIEGYSDENIQDLNLQLDIILNRDTAQLLIEGGEFYAKSYCRSLVNNLGIASFAGGKYFVDNCRYALITTGSGQSSLSNALISGSVSEKTYFTDQSGQVYGAFIETQDYIDPSNPKT